MNPDPLRQFYNDEHAREAVLSHLSDYLSRKAVERVMERGDVSGLADAAEFVKGAFVELKERYGEEPKPVMQSSR